MATELTGARPQPFPGGRAHTWFWRCAGWGQQLVGPLVVGVIIIGTWQAGVWNEVWGLQSFTLPRPSDIVRAFGDSGNELWTNFEQSFKPAALGYLLGNAAGVVAGALLVVIPAGLARRLAALFAAIQALPIIALVPVVALWFGSELLFKTVVVAILTFPSMMVYSSRGMTHIGEDVGDLLASYDARRSQVFLKIRLPNSLPFAFTALRYNVVLAVIGVVVAEILRSRSGLGYEIDDALQAFDTAEAWAAATILAGLGVAWYTAVGVVERLLVPWGADQRNRSVS
jgi:NitT/TauT family transport system permease protein